MSNAKHTPGPWLVFDTTVYALNDRGVNRFFASVQDAHTDREELRANARLIAAAPELLNELEKAESEISDLLAELKAMNPDRQNHNEEAAQKRRHAAIAKAKGE